MKKYKYIIVEDLPSIAETLKFFVDKSPKYDFKGYALNLKGAIKLIKKFKPDLIFLDIELNNESGFDLIKLIKENNFHVPCIIVNSILVDYAIGCFNIEAIYFIHKPYTTPKIQTALELFEKRYRNKNDTLRIRNQDGEHFIKYKDIYFIEAQGTYSHLYTVQNLTYRFSKNLKEMTEVLSSDFVRVNRSFIVNKNHVNRIYEQKMYLNPLLLKEIAKEIETVIKNGIVVTENF